MRPLHELLERLQMLGAELREVERDAVTLLNRDDHAVRDHGPGVSR